MDQAIRNKLRSVVTQCRRLLEESIAQQLQGRFDIYATGKKDEVKAEDDVPLGHLSDEERQARQDILAHFRHIDSLAHKPKESLEQLIREIAFTHLNRLCAYKMMEVREVYVGGQRFREAVSKGLKSQGFMFYLADHPEDEKRYNAGDQEGAYKSFLNWLGGTLSKEIGVLFSPTDPANRVYPPQRVLDEVLDLLNSDELKGIWSEDETIGWVYQYFTPKELRDEARKESQAPRNSYELAFRNQFFTPRYVVEFLTDNTLGRIWYEMRKGDTRLKEQCRYMVRRPTEVFLDQGEQPPNDAAEGRDDLSQEELLKRPVYISHRANKDPREIKILDPACGSGHFLLYCFALLLVIYEEAYDDPDLGSGLRADYPTKDDLRRAAPGLILRHNLHGIDIDLRCTQIAALALWLRCQRAYHDVGLKKDRLRITKSNIVCAEPMPGEEALLKEFVAQIEPKLLGQLVEVVFDKMKLAGEAGSLLKIEEEIQDAVSEARRQWRIGPVATQMRLFGDQTPVVRQEQFDLSGITVIEFFEKAEDKVVDALRNYAERAQDGQRFERRLFTDDTVRGFAFVDLCHQQYDVVLMNPPFGDPSQRSRPYIHRLYTHTKNDLYSAFVERGLRLLKSRGVLGAITSRSGLFLTSFQKWRQEVVLSMSRPTVLADLGYGVLDSAMVETAAYCLERDLRVGTTIFLRLVPFEDKEARLEFTTKAVREGCSTNRIALPVNPDSFHRVPGCPFAYWVSDAVRRMFGDLSVCEGQGRALRQGGVNGDDFRFLRLFWEVPVPSTLDWRCFQKGGDYSPYYSDIHLVVNWDSSNSTFRGFQGLPHRPSLIPANCQHFFRRGITWSRRSQRGLSLRVLPDNCGFSDKGPVLFADNEQLWRLLGLMNSSAFRGLVALQMSFGSYEVGVLQRTVVPPLGDNKSERLAELSKAAVRIKQSMDLSNEVSHLFFLPEILQGQRERLIDSIGEIRHKNNKLNDLLYELEQTINSLSIDLYQLNSTERESLTETLKLTVVGENEEEVSDLEDEDAADASNAINRLVTDLVSYAVGAVFGRWDTRHATNSAQTPNLPDPFAPLTICSLGMLQCPDGLPGTRTPEGYPLRIDWDGILTDDPDHPDDIIRRVRDVLEVMWKNRADAIEKETCEILGFPELRDYFRKPGAGGFWDDHIKRYSKSRRKAPIYWLLQSSKKNYALWIYYHRLDKDILFKALLNYVEPKIRREESRLDEIRSQKTALGPAAKGAKKLDKDIDRQDAFLTELRDFEEKLRRAANLHLDPDLNDGVVLNIAPLREVVPWKEAKSYWDDLMEGKYEWSSIGKQLREKGLVK